MKKICFYLLLGLLPMAALANNEENSQLFPTVLKVTVLDDIGNPVQGATVTLYNNETDYHNRENPAYESAETDEKGEVRFKKIDARRYLIEAEKGDMSNEGGGIETQHLEKGKVNQIRIIIE
ncbi:MAG: carboxypeptidase-like regulatory domain-containing protein [Cyclobacteriaceae bacterium]